MDAQIKSQLYQTCSLYLQKRFDAIESRLKDLDESLGAETKSSVGDKYETGRAMLHLEKEKQMRQLAVLLESKQLLASIDAQKKCEQVEQGALVITNQGAFYIAISAGKLTVEHQLYFAITLASPIGKLLFHKKAGEQFQFRGRTYKIEAVL